MLAPEFWRRDGVVPRLLAPAAAAWRAGAAVKRRIGAPVRVGAPTICVGNAVAGGAGKTPVALAVAKALAARGAAPHFLTRGYGGSERGPLRVDPAAHDAGRVGDEALLLAAAAPAWIARNRAAGARAAANGGAGVVVMDDGLQNFGVAKDYALLVVDGGFGFGNGRVMPAGPLREPVRDAMRRVDAVVIVGEDKRNLGKDLRPPVLAARFVPSPGSESIAGRPVIAFAGIGRPEKFFETLAGMGCDLVSVRRFPDHHAYKADEGYAMRRSGRSRRRCRGDDGKGRRPASAGGPENGRGAAGRARVAESGGVRPAGRANARKPRSPQTGADVTAVRTNRRDRPRQERLANEAVPRQRRVRRALRKRRRKVFGGP